MVDLESIDNMMGSRDKNISPWLKELNDRFQSGAILHKTPLSLIPTTISSWILQNIHSIQTTFSKSNLGQLINNRFTICSTPRSILTKTLMLWSMTVYSKQRKPSNETYRNVRVTIEGLKENWGTSRLHTECCHFHRALPRRIYPHTGSEPTLTAQLKPHGLVLEAAETSTRLSLCTIRAWVP